MCIPLLGRSVDPFQPQFPCCFVPFFDTFPSEYLPNFLMNPVFTIAKDIKLFVKFVSRDSCVAAARVTTVDHLSDIFLRGQGVAHGMNGYDRLELFGDSDGRRCFLFWGVFIEEPLFDIRKVYLSQCVWGPFWAI